MPLPTSSGSLCLCVLALAGLSGIPASQQDEDESTRLYFGNGCFFAHQHLLIEEFERGALARKDAELTAIQGYAGSAHSGPQGTACYHNAKNFSDYGDLGRAEVVELDVPFESLGKAFEIYFGSFVEIDEGQWSRPDYYDQGAEYRSLVGVPGGMSNARVLEAMRHANTKNFTLRTGQGSDPDTFGTSTVFVMDSAQFPFIQAEVCLQFHDDPNEHYPASYHNLRGTFERRGRLVGTSCPPNYICGSAGNAAALATLSV